MEITVNRHKVSNRLYLDVSFPNDMDLASEVLSRGYRFDNIVHPQPGRVWFVLSPGQGPKAANFIIQYLRTNYAVRKLTWKCK